MTSFDICVADCACGKRVVQRAEDVDGVLVCPDCENPIVSYDTGVAHLDPCGDGKFSLRIQRDVA